MTQNSKYVWNKYTWKLAGFKNKNTELYLSHKNLTKYCKQAFKQDSFEMYFNGVKFQAEPSNLADIEKMLEGLEALDSNSIYAIEILSIMKDCNLSFVPIKQEENVEEIGGNIDNLSGKNSSSS